MRAIITEKASVAREIAQVLNVTRKHEGYYSGKEFLITWTSGPLVGPAMPQDYGLKGFNEQNLPILPRPFVLCIRKIKQDGAYVPDPAAVCQLRTINEVFNRCDSIIVATEANREGELSLRYIYDYLLCKKPFERLWLNALTDKEIRSAFKNLRSGTDYEGLYRAAMARSRADWLLGINASQALSIALGQGVFSLGRVQTPALTLICQRFLECRNFTPQNYQRLQVALRRDFVDFRGLSQTKWDNQGLASRALNGIKKEGTVRVTQVESKTLQEQPPLLFNLTGLQKAANKRLGLTAEETLCIAQSLYEQQFITFPRTGCRYIPNELWSEIPSLVRALEARSSCTNALKIIKWGRFNNRMVNDARVFDHHGLLITEKIPSALSAKEDAVYDLIALRLLESIAPDAVMDTSDVSLQALDVEFLLKTCSVKEPGWRSVMGDFSLGNRQLGLPELAVGDVLKIKQASVLKMSGQPPKPFTEATLLSVMEQAGAWVAKDGDSSDAPGIGTPSTRAAVIEALIRRGYVHRENRFLIPTEKGLMVYDLVKDKKIASLDLSLAWERELHKIETGEAKAEVFLKDIEAFTAEVTQELLDLKVASEALPVLTCPKCQKEELLIRHKLVKCPNEFCGWMLFREVCGVHLSVSELNNLLVNGSTSLLKGLKSKSNKSFNAFIVLEAEGGTAFSFEKSHKKRKGE